MGRLDDIDLVRADDLIMVPYGFVEGMIARNARAANLDTVIIDSRIMKRAGKITGLDVEKIMEDIARETFDARRCIGDVFAPAGDTAPKF
ncbi:hypothetical protein [Ketogulonicigenium robustum]|uniref:hypothetical protein n=1 Tax=Ketogulonicigenium robustum TaxID=92947 RepID=UPI000A269127|nr:hypothetical protein [Ketogulonicigenium robustum]